MAEEVIKKDGTKEPFDPEKIRNSITAACGEAGLPDDRKNEVVKQVARTAIELADSKEEIATSEIRDKILNELDNVEPAAAASWRKTEETKGVSEGEEEAGETEETEEEPTS